MISFLRVIEAVASWFYFGVYHVLQTAKLFEMSVKLAHLSWRRVGQWAAVPFSPTPILSPVLPAEQLPPFLQIPHGVFPGPLK